MDYSNIASMLSRLKGQTAYSEQNVSGPAGKSLQAAEILLKNMEPGQIFSGEITDIRGSYITIALQNMQSVQARLAENFEFLIGQKALFQVKDNQAGQLLIRPVALDMAQSGELMVAERALHAAGIQMTEKTLELVRNLMSAGQPIDKQSISSYVRQLAKFPQAEISDLISLNKYQIPVNEENLNQLANYRQFEHSLLKDFTALSQELPHALEQMSAADPERAQTFVKELADILYGKPSGDSGITQEAGWKGEEEPAFASQTGNAGREELLYSNRTETGNARMTAEEQLNRLQTELSHLNGKEWKDKAGDVLRNALEEKLLLKPEEVSDKERVKEYYKEIADKGERLKELFSSYGKETAQLEKPVQNLGQNLKFMQTLNEMFTYIQLPLKLANEQAHGDLYVYTKRKIKGTEEEGVSAFLHLEMEHLGKVDVLVRLKGKKAATDFTLETEELLDFVGQHMELLEKRLEKKGYSCSMQVMLKNAEEQEKSFEQYLTGEAEESAGRKRFSFDVRA